MVEDNLEGGEWIFIIIWICGFYLLFIEGINIIDLVIFRGNKYD